MGNVLAVDVSQTGHELMEDASDMQEIQMELWVPEVVLEVSQLVVGHEEDRVVVALEGSKNINHMRMV